MKLLICTQAVDKNHSALGFFHEWLIEFSKNCEQVLVVCLEKGEYDLPENVTVHSLGKEISPASSLTYSWRLLRLAWKLRMEYDTVFVHMNPEYVLAGSPVWLALRRPVSLWYTHGSVSSSLRLAQHIVKHIFTAAKEGMNLRSKKVVVTGHGISDIAKNSSKQKDLDLITVGRITPAKNLGELIDLIEVVRKTIPTATLTIVGGVQTEEETRYQEKLKVSIDRAKLQNAVTWVGPVSHEMVGDWIARAKVFVHAAKNGSLDKVLLEAVMVGTPVVSSAPGAQALPLEHWQVNNLDDFSKEVVNTLKSPDSALMAKLGTHVEINHGLSALVVKLCKHMRNDYVQKTSQ